MRASPRLRRVSGHVKRNKLLGFLDWGKIPLEGVSFGLLQETVEVGEEA